MKQFLLKPEMYSVRRRIIIIIIIINHVVRGWKRKEFIVIVIIKFSLFDVLLSKDLAVQWSWKSLMKNNDIKKKKKKKEMAGDRIEMG